MTDGRSCFKGSVKEGVNVVGKTRVLKSKVWGERKTEGGERVGESRGMEKSNAVWVWGRVVKERPAKAGREVARSGDDRAEMERRKADGGD